METNATVNIQKLQEMLLEAVEEKRFSVAVQCVVECGIITTSLAREHQKQIRAELMEQEETDLYGGLVYWQAMLHASHREGFHHAAAHACREIEAIVYEYQQRQIIARGFN